MVGIGSDQVEMAPPLQPDPSGVQTKERSIHQCGSGQDKIMLDSSLTAQGDLTQLYTAGLPFPSLQRLMLRPW